MIAASLAQQSKAAAASTLASLAGAEAVFGELSQARSDATRSIALQPDDPPVSAGFALAYAGDSAAAEKIFAQLAKLQPESTLLNTIQLPICRAALAIARHDPAKALSVLQPASSYALSSDDPYLYFSGLAHLAAGQGKQAASDFQSIRDHKGIFAVNELNPAGGGVFTFAKVYPLAELGLARERAMEGDKTGAATAYQNFLAEWKDADHDLPILKQAKAEYAKLQ